MGASDVKNYINNEINKLFGLNDISIDNLMTMSNKENTNILFDRNRDEVLYFFEKLEEYRKEEKKYKEKANKDKLKKNGKR